MQVLHLKRTGTKEMILREAQFSDYKQVSALFTEELAQHVALKPDVFQMPDTVITEEWFRKDLSNQATIIYLAKVDHQIAGLIQVMIRNNPDDPIFRKRRYAHIEDIIVAQTHRGKGVGRFLMEAAQEWAKIRGACAVDLWVWKGNENAIEFYEHLGYQTIRQAMQLKLA
jgi:ribosomal protein S18 acetylase RimI-like enzyme